ncbi:hypothetical protein PIB30_017789 [Stylosanthes scabra]|uniref:Uncharacterized protein n=1 Tax=Stylosanthes scabra TaxID=79078 RepID=A0ABU6U6H9_9FABA|nr:hypothetical protein [Stylosanthes scabra]
MSLWLIRNQPLLSVFPSSHHNNASFPSTITASSPPATAAAMVNKLYAPLVSSLSFFLSSSLHRSAATQSPPPTPLPMPPLPPRQGDSGVTDLCPPSSSVSTFLFALPSQICAVFPWGQGFMNKTSPLPERFYLGGVYSQACFLFLRVTTFTHSGRMSMIAARQVLGSASQLLHRA